MAGVVVVHSVKNNVTRVLTENVDAIPDMESNELMDAIEVGLVNPVT